MDENKHLNIRCIGNENNNRTFHKQDLTLYVTVSITVETYNVQSQHSQHSLMIIELLHFEKRILLWRCTSYAYIVDFIIACLSYIFGITPVKHAAMYRINKNRT